MKKNTGKNYVHMGRLILGVIMLCSTIMIGLIVIPPVYKIVDIPQYEVYIAVTDIPKGAPITAESVVKANTTDARVFTIAYRGEYNRTMAVRDIKQGSYVYMQDVKSYAGSDIAKP